MLTEQLADHQDLIESLDTEPIFDYLLQHGVLTTHVINDICKEQCQLQRNTTLLKHVEDSGHNAVALFINALRQSGQLHLASSLDVSQRIKPIYGTGYWEKRRHKGQVVVQITVSAVKVLVPRDEGVSVERVKKREFIEVKMTPRRLHKSYDNMLMIETEEVNSTRPIRITSYSRTEEGEDPEEEEGNPRRACWCMCFPFRKKSKSKQYATKKEKNSKTKPKPDSPSKWLESPSKEKTVSTSPGRKHYPETGRGKKNVNSANKGNLELNGNSDNTKNGGSSSKMDASLVRYKNHRNEYPGSTKLDQDNKENTDSVIMKYNIDLELVEMKRYSQILGDKLSINGSTMTNSLVEKWKSNGKKYEEKSTEFYKLFDKHLKTDVVKYFEQERGTLILQIFSDKNISIFNICMTKDHVARIREHYQSGTLQKKMETLLLSGGTVEKLGILGITFNICIEDDQFEKALQEL
ncbi:uncharacterized protein LOC121390558 [Gigantopelta aegis]|uniref:uncharacterized protein LOC121390558 n=1 Tax=Gigantopelta aegis TaxID=1735272 RepID=UPI001B88BD20|nr:uncharacterized protein LOC121390558 [Gigantopelta aegis]XP_041378337.1 uncharacterized protein LOC121390558 [Gigantopelta aegis]